MMSLLFLAGLCVAIAALVVAIYNALVRARQMARESWSGIDVQLLRRADLIPNLIETVKGYAAHERKTFEEVVAARNRAMGIDQSDVKNRAMAENLLGQAFGKLFVLSEAHPDLKASDNFRDLQASLETIEQELQMARRYYNAAARDLKVKIESFPSNLIAGLFGFVQQSYFEIDTVTVGAVPSVRI